MTRDEHLYTIAAEEAVEVAQRCSKAIRFGPGEVQPGQDLDNRARILEEYAQLVGVLEMLGFDVGRIPVNLRVLADAKKTKVEKFLEYSRECGTLEEGESTPLEVWNGFDSEPSPSCSVCGSVAVTGCRTEFMEPREHWHKVFVKSREYRCDAHPFEAEHRAPASGVLSREVYFRRKADEEGLDPPPVISSCGARCSRYVCDREAGH